MNTQPDFEDFFRLLESNGVEYMVVGGYAVAFHRFLRFIKNTESLSPCPACPPPPGLWRRFFRHDRGL